MPLRENRVRNPRGAAVMTLCIVLLFFFIFLIFFVFDMNRIQMAQRQLTALCDSASLAGSAMLTAVDTSFDTGTDSLNTAQLASVQYAKNMIAMGNILGNQCYDPAMSAPPPHSRVRVNFVNNDADLHNPGPGVLNVWIQLVQPINGYIPVPAGNTSARGIWVQCDYGYAPYLAVLGVTSVHLPATSTSSLQKLYVVMVFDCSGSMDDNTEVSFVYRRWSDSSDSAAVQATNGGKGQYVYTIVGTPGNGQLWQYAGLDYTAEPNGTNVNVLPPQNLDYLGFVYGNQHFSYGNSQSNFDVNNPPLAFDMAMADYVPWPAGVPGTPNSVFSSYPIANPNSGFQGPYFDNYFGTPPGNCPVKYGPAPPGSSYGGQVVPDITNPLKSLNVVNGATAAQLPGPGFSPGYNYYPTGPLNPNDGNIYFYDPYSMPARNTNANLIAFTDMVANLTAVNPPVAQPIYGPSVWTSTTQVNQSFSAASAEYSVAVAETTSQSLTQTGYYEYDTTLNSVINYPFLSIAYLVEASRGNMDLEWSGNAYVNNTTTNYDNALLGYGSNLGANHPTQANVRAGYQKAYQRLAMYVMQPYATAVDGARRFFQNLCAICDVGFGFVGFSVTPATTASYKCAYLGPATTGDTSLAVGAPADTIKPQSVYSSYVYQPLAGCNPNFWVSDCFTAPDSNSAICPAGPAGSPTGEAYHATLNTTGPNRATWLSVNGGSPPSNSDTLWANNNPGFQIPRTPLYVIPTVEATQGQAYYRVAGDDWEGYSYTQPGRTANNYGCNGIQHARPLYETAGLEALTYAYYNLTNVSSLSSLTLGETAGIVLPNEYGSKRCIVEFTDGIPTDDTGPAYTQYMNNVVKPAQNSGVVIYSIGLALNPTLANEQAPFLKALANFGANGSQEFQVTNAASLTSTFTGIARQLAQGQR